MIVKLEDARIRELEYIKQNGKELTEDESDELIRLIYNQAKGGRDETARLWDACQKLVKNETIKRLRGLHRSQDQVEDHPLASESAMIFLRFIAEYNGPDTEFSSKLLTTIEKGLGKARKAWREGAAKAQRMTPEIEDSLVLDTSARPEERRQAVQMAIASLPDDLREVIELRYFQGEKLQDIAKSLGVSRKTITNRHGRAKDALRKALVEALDIICI